MEKFYKINLITGIFLLIVGFFCSTSVFGKTHADTFDDGRDGVSSFDRTIGGIKFKFLFTADGDGGDFAFFPGVNSPVSVVPNTAPVATAPSAPTINEDASNVALPDDIQIADVDGDNQTVSFTITGGILTLGTTGITFAGSGNGSASFIASGTPADINAALDAATFTPTANLYGANAGTISFVSNDGTVNSNTASVTFNINGVNDKPTISGLPADVVVQEDAATDPFDISSAIISDIDAESGELTLTLAANGGVFDIATGTGITIGGHLTSNLTLTGNLTDLNNYINFPTNIYFRPNANLSGNNAASVQVSINDNGNTGSGGGSDVAAGTVNVDITAVNDAPIAVDDNVDVDENTPRAGNVLTNDSDIEGNALTASLVTAPVNGTVVLNADGSFTYTPNADYTGSDNLVYQVCDNGTPSLCDTATVYFDVLPAVNNAPVLSNTAGNTSWTEGNPPTIIKPLIGVGDPDGDNISKATVSNLLFVAGDVLSVATPGPYSVDYNTSSGVLTLSGTGTAAEMQTALRTVAFRNSGDNPGLGNTKNTRIVSFFVEDENGATSEAVTNPGIFVSSINDAPTVTLPASISVMEDTNSPLTGISFADVDAGSTDVTTTFSIPNGTFSASSSGGVTVTGSGTGNLSLSGTLAAMNTFIAGSKLNFLNQPGNSSNQTLTVSINDNGNTGSGVPLQGSGTATLTVIPSPPVITSVFVPANGTYGVTQSLDFTVNFDESIIVNAAGGIPGLSVTVGSSTETATYISGSGTNALVFEYTVQNGDLDANGIQVTALSSNGATLRNGSGTDADLSLNNIGNTSGVLVDGVAPSGYSVTIDQDPILPANESAVSFTFAGAEIGTTYSYTFISSGGGTSVSGNGTIATATEQVTGIDLSGLVAGTITLAVTLEDAKGNAGSEVIDTSVKLAPITAQFVSQSDVLCRGGADGSLTVQVNDGTANYSYSWSNGAFTSNSSSATNTISSLAAGNYSVTVTDGNGQEATALATITEPVMATVTTSAASSITFSGAVLGGTVAYGDATCEKESGIVYSTSPNPTLSDTKAVMPVTAGSFGQQVTGLQINTTYYVRAFSTNDNDVTAYGNEVSFTTSKKTLTVTANAGQSKVYGGTDPVLTYTATGFANGDDASILSGALTRESGEDAGIYAIQLGSLSAGANYTINFTGADFTISKKNLMVTADAGQSKVYGETDPTFTYTASGFDNGDNGSVLSGSLSRVAGESVGIYAIQLGTLSAGANYTIDFTAADFAIAAKALTVAATAADKTYDGNNSATVTLSDDRIPGDVLTISSEPAVFDNKNTGTSKVVTVSNIAISGTDAGNYTVNIVATTTADIIAKSLTITADDKEKSEGEANPPLTASFEGFVAGEDEGILTTQPDLSTTATISSLPGNYPITASGAAAQNYSISLVAGTLTVKAGAPTSVSLAPITVYENSPSGTAAGLLSSTSDSPAATFTYTLVGGTGDTDNSLFSISGNQLLTAAPLNYEAKAVYSIRVRSTTQHNLSLEETFSIGISDVNEAPTIDPVADQSICYTDARQTITLNGITAGPDAGQSTDVTVASSNSGLLSELTINNGELRYRAASGQSGTSQVTVTVKDNGGTDNGGIDQVSTTFNITINALPVASINSNIGESISKGETAILTATGGNSYEWSNSAGIINGQNSAALTVRPLETTTYTVKVSNASGCESSTSITIRVKDDFQAIKPENFITPNGDGINDVWVVKNIDAYPDHALTVVDRGGRKVYEARNYSNDWDGTVGGNPLQEGTYYYIFLFDDPNVSPMKGFITIVR